MCYFSCVYSIKSSLSIYLPIRHQLPDVEYSLHLPAIREEYRAPRWGHICSSLLYGRPYRLTMLLILLKRWGEPSLTMPNKWHYVNFVALLSPTLNLPTLFWEPLALVVCAVFCRINLVFQGSFFSAITWQPVNNGGIMSQPVIKLPQRAKWNRFVLFKNQLVRRPNNYSSLLDFSGLKTLSSKMSEAKRN